MSAQPQAIRVRISPGFRMWQALIVAAAIVLSLLLGLAIGRSTTAAPTRDTVVRPAYVEGVACTGHLPKRGCRDAAESGYTADAPPGGVTTRLRHG
jgi:hypothetical protein